MPKNLQIGHNKKIRNFVLTSKTMVFCASFLGLQRQMSSSNKLKIPKLQSASEETMTESDNIRHLEKSQKTDGRVPNDADII